MDAFDKSFGCEVERALDCMLFLTDTDDACGFFHTCEDFSGKVGLFIPHLHFFFFFLKVKISSCTLIPLFMLGSVHRGPAS